MSLGWMEDQLLVLSKWHTMYKYCMCVLSMHGAEYVNVHFYVYGYSSVHICWYQTLRVYFNAKIHKKNKFLLLN